MFGVASGPTVRVCCGPRCGAEPGHRAIYAAIEAAAAARDVTVLPTMCQGLCGQGVTVVLAPDEKRKVREAGEAADILGAIAPSSC